MTNPKFKAVHPVLPVRDVAEAVRYYTGKLGFTLLFQHPAGSPDYAGVGRDSVELHLQRHDEASFEFVERLQLRLYVEGVDELFEEYEGKDVFHENTALRDTPWGTREFAFCDPDTNGLTFYRDL